MGKEQKELAVLTQEQLIEAMRGTAKPKPIRVDVPEWGGTVFIRVRTVAEVDADVTEDSADKDDGTRLARGAARVLCNEKGDRILDHRNPEHIALLSKQPWPLLQRVISASNVAMEEFEGKK